jgi:hypothetical protein
MADDKGKGGYKWLNYLLGLITFGLIVYFVNLIRGERTQRSKKAKGNSFG